jgi:hypothetical protein
MDALTLATLIHQLALLVFAVAALIRAFRWCHTGGDGGARRRRPRRYVARRRTV